MRLEEQLGEILKQRNATICTAESCTGGLIASRITDISGSSAYMLGGIVSYSNEIKQKLLGVQEETLRDYGAVSEETAQEMALGALITLGADYALSVTGIAGPGGATPGKPVGLTYIGLAGTAGVMVIERHIWQGDREENKRLSADAALSLILRHLE